jgi:hypothetical protein
MSEFMSVLDGQYAMNYRQVFKGRGYVFQGRYKSILVEEEKYLRMVIVYVLLNLVRAGFVHSPYDYRWSSIGEYYTGRVSGVVENRLVEEVFGDRKELDNLLREWLDKEDISVKDTRFGKILGDEVFIEKSLQRFDRRREQGVSKRMRHKEANFESPDSLIRRFEIDKGIRLDEIDCKTKGGRILRYDLLRLLKEQAGLQYKQIILYKPFSNLKFGSLGQMYKRAKQRERGESKKR